MIAIEDRRDGLDLGVEELDGMVEPWSWDHFWTGFGYGLAAAGVGVTAIGVGVAIATAT